MAGNLRKLYRRLTSYEGDMPMWAVPAAALRWVVVFYKELRRDKAFITAGSMAYITLIALVPLLLLVFGVLGATGLLEPSRQALETLLIETVLGDIPEVREFLLPGLMSVDLATLGIVGVIGMVVISARMYMMVELAYNDVFSAPIDRPLGQRLLNFYFVLTALPVALGISVLGTEELVGGGGYTWLTPVITFGMLAAALKLFPCTRVKWQAVLAGAAVSAVLLEFGGRLFPLYIRWFASDDPLRIVYGSVALIPLFLVWLYLLWVFVLLGVEVAYVAQNFESLSALEFELGDPDQTVRAPTPALAVEVSARIGRAFQRGEGPLALDRIALATGCRAKDLRPVLGVLEECGIVVETERGWTVSQPPEQIRLPELLEAWRERVSYRRDEHDVVGDAFGEALSGCFDGTLADAIDWWLGDQGAALASASSGPVGGSGSST